MRFKQQRVNWTEEKERPLIFPSTGFRVIAQAAQRQRREGVYVGVPISPPLASGLVCESSSK